MYMVVVHVLMLLKKFSLLKTTFSMQSDAVTSTVYNNTICCFVFGPKISVIET